MQILKGKNGVTVLYRKATSKFVDIQYGVDCGSIDELNPEEWGLCHALEHMLFRGTETRSWDELSHSTAILGGYTNAQTTYARTLYQMNVPRDKFEQGFELLADCFYNSTLPSEWWEVEKGAIISEIEGDEDDADVSLHEEAMQSLLGDRLHKIGGNVENIKKAKVEDLAKFRKRFYTGNKVVVAVAGNLSPKKVLSVVNKFDQWASSSPLKRKPLPKKLDLSPLRKKKLGLSQTYLMKIKPVHTVTDKEDSALLIAANTLSHLLHSKVREELGLCYQIGCFLTDEVPGHKFTGITTYFDPKKEKEALVAINETLVEYLNGNIGKDNLDESRALLRRNVLVSSDAPSRLTVDMIDSYLDGKKRMSIDTLSKYIDELSDSYIRKIAVANISGKYKDCKLTN